MVRTPRATMKPPLPFPVALAAGLLFSAGASATAAPPAAPAPASGPSAPPSNNTKSPELPATWKDANGKPVNPLADHGQKATLLFFLTTECPIGNGYAPEITRIVDAFRQAGISCYAVYAHETAAEVRKHLLDYKLTLPAVLDPALGLATLTGATVTPEACLLSPSGTILYRGRIDDRAVKFGSVRREPRVRDLRLALDAVCQGKPVPVRFTKPIGCYIDFPTAPRK